MHSRNAETLAEEAKSLDNKIRKLLPKVQESKGNIFDFFKNLNAV
jgi:hypothetical protein